MTTYPTPWLTLALSSALAALLIGCQTGVSTRTTTPESAVVESKGHQKKIEDEIDEAFELAPYMGQLQRFSQKLGFSLQNKNQALSEFYKHELEEVFEELGEIEEHEGMPIAQPIAIIIDPILLKLGAAVSASDWKSSWLEYEALIDGCNRCHAASEHEFIEITPAKGQPAYNQKF